MDYGERRAQAQSIYESGLRKVSETPAPEGQKFPIGSFVRISKDLGSSMSHFENDKYARVEYTYAHAYWGDDNKSYSLLVQYAPGKWSTVAWYYEHQLTLVDDPALIEDFKEEISKSDLR